MIWHINSFIVVCFGKVCLPHLFLLFGVINDGCLEYVGLRWNVNDREAEVFAMT